MINLNVTLTYKAYIFISFVILTNLKDIALRFPKQKNGKRSAKYSRSINHDVRLFIVVPRRATQSESLFRLDITLVSSEWMGFLHAARSLEHLRERWAARDFVAAPIGFFARNASRRGIGAVCGSDLAGCLSLRPSRVPDRFANSSLICRKAHLLWASAGSGARRLGSAGGRRIVSKQGTQRVHRRGRQAMMHGNGFWDENGEMYPLDFLGGGGGAEWAAATGRKRKGTLDTLAKAPSPWRRTEGF